MINLYYWPTPNARKVSILFEELKLKYNLIKVDINKGEQFFEKFLKISPNNKIPAIEFEENGKKITLFESGVILLFFAENYDFFVSFSMASTIISSSGLKVFNSVFLNYDTNYVMITFMMLISLFIIPLLFILNSKKPFQFCYTLILKYKLNIFFFFFLTLFLLIIFSRINLEFVKKYFLLYN